MMLRVCPLDSSDHPWVLKALYQDTKGNVFAFLSGSEVPLGHNNQCHWCHTAPRIKEDKRFIINLLHFKTQQPN